MGNLIDLNLEAEKRETMPMTYNRHARLLDRGIIELNERETMAKIFLHNLGYVIYDKPILIKDASDLNHFVTFNLDDLD